MGMDAALADYRRLIEQLADGKVNLRVPNSEPQHAAILLETMFLRAASDMRIYTGELRKTTYGVRELCVAARRFVSNPRNHLYVLLQKPCEGKAASHPFIESLMDGGLPSNAEIRYAEGVYATDDANHFAVMDAEAYRYEMDHNATKAFANFNEPSVATKLRHAFDQAFDLGKPLDLAAE